MSVFNSYLLHRRIIGIIGIVLPIVLLIGASIQNSISAYYFTPMRDILVSCLIIVGAFLLIYACYSKIDNIVSSIAGGAAIITALFPTDSIGVYEYSFIGLSGKTSSLMHIIFSAIFFICLIIMSGFLFTKSIGPVTSKKKIRNIIYIICGSVMLVFLILLGIMNAFGLAWVNFTFIAESIMLLAFGVSWFIKGETLLKDK